MVFSSKKFLFISTLTDFITTNYVDRKKASLARTLTNFGNVRSGQAEENVPE
jgi:hypothetical protein